jgi:hypothetical protein
VRIHASALFPQHSDVRTGVSDVFRRGSEHITRKRVVIFRVRSTLHIDETAGTLLALCDADHATVGTARFVRSSSHRNGDPAIARMFRTENRRMTGKNRRRIEMAKRALDFSRAHLDPSPGYAAALARLEERLTRAQQLATQQRLGILEVRSSTEQKRDLRRQMRRGELAHLSGAADIGSAQLPELTQKFTLVPSRSPYLAFRTAARSMAAEAEANKELLVKHGLAETVLESLTVALDEFDRAIERGNEGRRQHVGASAELDTVSDELVQIVRMMDGLNRVRFANEPQSAAAWESASNTLGPARSSKPAPAPAPTEPPSSGGEIKPAA